MSAVYLYDGKILKTCETLNDTITNSGNVGDIHTIVWIADVQDLTDIDLIFSCKNLQILIVVGSKVTLGLKEKNENEKNKDEKNKSDLTLNKLKTLFVISEFHNEFATVIDNFPNLESYMNTSEDNVHYNIIHKISLESHPNLRHLVMTDIEDYIEECDVSSFVVTRHYDGEYEYDHEHELCSDKTGCSNKVEDSNKMIENINEEVDHYKNSIHKILSTLLPSSLLFYIDLISDEFAMECSDFYIYTRK